MSEQNSTAPIHLLKDEKFQVTVEIIFYLPGVLSLTYNVVLIVIPG